MKNLYRPEIDGLRALAVIAVIFNHFNKELLPGGFLGVDIFFVISGYVITSSLATREHKSLKDFFQGFYARRIKRLMPALIVCVSMTCLVGFLFIPPAPEFTTTWRTGVAAVFGLSNLYLFNRSTDYFTASTELNLFTQTWSLGVEEQFYLIFPLIFWFSGFFRNRPHARRNLLLAMLLLSAASLCTYLWLSTINQPAAYFLMPARFWELGLGCITFLALNTQRELPRFFVRAGAFLATPLLFSVIILFTQSMSLANSTILVVLLTSLLLATIESNSRIYNVLTWKPIVFIGLISYSLYLWHWSVLAISQWTIGIHPWTIPIQLGLILGLSVISNRYVENKFRYTTWPISKIRFIGYGIGASFACAGLLYILGEPLKGRLYTGKLDAIENQIHQGGIDGTSINESNCSWWNGEGPLLNESKSLCSLKSKTGNNRQRIIVLGDSHAGHLVGLLKRLHFDEDFPIRLLYVHSQPVPLVQGNLKTLEKRRDYETQRLIIKETLSDLHQGDILVLSNFILNAFNPDNTAGLEGSSLHDRSDEVILRNAAFRGWLKELDHLAKIVRLKQAKLVLFAPLPEFRSEPFPAAVCAEEWFRKSLSENCKLYANRRELKSRIDDLKSGIKPVELRNKNFFLYDPFPVICPAEPVCSNYLNGTRVFLDKHHLNNTAGEYLHRDFIRFLVDKKLAQID